LEITIEKLVYGGDGLGRLPGNEQGRGKAVFVPFTLTGEKVQASIEEDKRGFARAKVENISAASVHRIEPACPYFQRCGGCHYQHTDYENQLAIKSEILSENLRRLAKLKLPTELRVHPSPPWNYRNRTRLQVRAEGDFALGYFKASSHALLPVETCPISSPLLNRAIQVLWQMGRAGKVPPGLREIELFANDDDSQLQIELYTDPRMADQRNGLRSAQALAELLRSELRELVSVYSFSQTRATARGIEGHISEEPDWVLHPGEFRYRTRSGALRVSGGSFFQVNRFLVDELLSIVTTGRSGRMALDLYAGVGLFSVALASSFHHITAVESSQSSVADLQYNSQSNVKAVRATVDEFLNRRGANLHPDLVVADPPRAGLGDRVTRALAKLAAPRLMYVSCDPATLARDLVPLIGGGYQVEQAHLVDLFPQTYHIETVVELVR